jgi:hypothetical protein
MLAGFRLTVSHQDSRFGFLAALKYTSNCPRWSRFLWRGHSCRPRRLSSRRMQCPADAGSKAGTAAWKGHATTAYAKFREISRSESRPGRLGVCATPQQYCKQFAGRCTRRRHGFPRLQSLLGRLDGGPSRERRTGPAADLTQAPFPLTRGSLRPPPPSTRAPARGGGG